ncbi:MAG: serine hydrolase domain-containing protein, partial [archaeon]|nr:serine hydrolase domain-containing protein [archaeon]
FLVCWPHVAPAVEASSACFWTPEVNAQGGTYEMSASVMQQVEEIVGSFRTKYLLPSVSVSVSVGNRIVYQKGFGFQDGVSGPNVTGDSLYRIGSLSKIFTTLLTLQMIDRGEVVSLDDNILNYEPLFTIDGTSAGYRNSSITLRQLSSHTGTFSIRFIFISFLLGRLTFYSFSWSSERRTMLSG